MTVSWYSIKAAWCSLELLGITLQLHGIFSNQYSLRVRSSLRFSCKIEPEASQRERVRCTRGVLAQRGTLGDQNNTKITSKGAQMEPEGQKLDQNGAKRAPKCIQKWMLEKRSARGRLPDERDQHVRETFGGKGRSGDKFWK